jgi:hypothetical protein
MNSMPLHGTPCALTFDKNTAAGGPEPC